MRLVISGFSPGLISEGMVTKMGLVQLEGGAGDNEVHLSKCPVVDVNAMHFRPQHAISKLPGRDSLQADPWVNAPILRLFQWMSEEESYFTLVFSAATDTVDAKIATIAQQGGSLIFSDLTLTGVASGWAPTVDDAIDCCTFGGSAVFTYGHSDLPPLVHDGSNNVYALTGTDVPLGAKTVATWGPYLFVGNIIESSVRTHSRVRWSNMLDASTWDALSFLDLDPQDGDMITAMWILHNSLVVFKRYKMYLIKYVGGDIVFDWERIDTTVGCVGPNAITEVNGVLYFISYAGICAFDGQHPPQNIDNPINDMILGWNTSLLYTAECDYYGDNKLIFTVPDGVSPKKNRLYLYDLDIPSWTKHDMEVSCLGNMTSLSADRYIDFPLPYESYNIRILDTKSGLSDLFVMGSYDGYVYRYGYNLNDLSNAIDAYMVTPWIDFGYSDYNKRILRVYIYADGTQNSIPIQFFVYTDWDDTIPKLEKTFNTESSHLAIVERRIDFTYPCRAVKFKIRVNQLDASFTLHKVIIDFLIKGRTITN